MIVQRFNIRRDRWSLEEILDEEGVRPGRGAFAFVLDDEHFPYFRPPQSREFAEALEQAAPGDGWHEVALGDDRVRITVTVHLIHGSAPALVDDNLGKTGNALHACERATRQLSALSP